MIIRELKLSSIAKSLPIESLSVASSDISRVITLSNMDRVLSSIDDKLIKTVPYDSYMHVEAKDVKYGDIAVIKLLNSNRKVYRIGYVMESEVIGLVGDPLDMTLVKRKKGWYITDTESNMGNLIVSILFFRSPS